MLAQTILVHLRPTFPTAVCPRCGTRGSRVHSHYERTIADVSFAGRGLVLKVLVRKWLCPDISCPQRIFAEQFPELVQRYARMTDRVIGVLQSFGVITNGVDAARIASKLGLLTTAKTIIRHVLQLPLPKNPSIQIVGIDEWAWKKGSRYGTILVDLEHRRVADLLPERSVETSAAWFQEHPEVKIVSRDRGKIFREAASVGAPQAQQIADRFHLQQNFADALEHFFRHHKQALKTAARQLAGKVHPASKTLAKSHIDQERQRRHRQRVRLHKDIWALFRAGQHKKEIARIVGISSRSVYRVLDHEQPPAREVRHWTHHLIDPYLSFLSVRWNEGCHKAVQLYEEIVTQGYTGSLRTIEKTVKAFRHAGTQPVGKHTILFQKTPSARSAALMMVRPVEHHTLEQIAFIEQIVSQDSMVATAWTLTQEFGQLLRKLEGKSRLEQWKAAVHSSGITELIRFVDGLTADEAAVTNACTEPWSNGMVEGFNQKVKLIKRSSYGQAGFPLLQRRVLLHPSSQETFSLEKRRELC